MRRQLAGGDCTGVTCATAWEAEVAARAGLHDDILVANEVADPGGLASLRRAAEHARITVAIDSPRHLELLDGIDCRVLIEINVGQDRCGLDPADEAAIVALAERAGERFRGLQGYEGHAVLLPERPSREEQVERAATILNRLRGRARLRARLRRRHGHVRPLHPPRRDPGRLLRPAGRQLRRARPPVRGRAHLPDDDRLAQRHPRRLRRRPEGALGRVRPPARGRSGDRGRRAGRRALDAEARARTATCGWATRSC